MHEIGKLEGRIEELSAKIETLHDDILIIKTKFNGGPGQSVYCVKHQNDLATLAQRFAVLEKRFEYGVGALATVVVIVNLILPFIHKIFP